MDNSSKLHSRLATWVKQSQEIKLAKETKISEKHEIDIFTPKFNKAALALNLGLTNEHIDSACKALEEKGFVIPRKTNSVRSPYEFDVEMCRMIADELGIKTIKERTGKKSRVIVVHQGKGGVGKSTKADVLSCEAHFDFKNRPRTLLLDGDTQGTLSLKSNEKLKAVDKTMTDIMTENFKLSREERLKPAKQAELKAKLESLMLDHKLNTIKILPSSSMDKFFTLHYSKEFAEASGMNEAKELIMTTFKDCIIEPLLDSFDQIIVDTSPDTNVQTMMQLYAATHVIVPVTGRSTDIEAFKDFFKVLEMLGNTLLPDDCGIFEMRPLVTLHREQPAAIETNANKVLKAMPDHFKTRIKYSTAYEKASDLGVSLHCLDTSTVAVRNALKLTKELYQEYRFWLGWDD
ncbi:MULTISPECIES: ParA family protein [Vibrio]|nr:ParA family protein [Vibrio tasmaniensis]PMO89906.1 hypothetical protein BCT01_01080 [Vibrio tasmaniensis]PMP17773.1 hypothetical protein BCS92_05035 [Vibrio tasmaniensis]